jgi:hypothetical protein
MRLRGAVDDKGGARQGLEGGGDRAVGVEIMRPFSRRSAASQLNPTELPSWLLQQASVSLS